MGRCQKWDNRVVAGAKNQFLFTRKTKFQGKQCNKYKTNSDSSMKAIDI